MSDHDEKNERGGRRSGGTGRESPPARNTAPAGTPAQKSPSISSLRGLSEPEEPPRAPAAKQPSDRPPPSDTISAPRTVGGHTARLKAREARDPSPEEESSPEAPAPKPAKPARSRAAALDGGEVASKGAPRSGDRSAAKAAEGARDGRGSWEADVKISDADLAVQKGQASDADGPRGAGESRWPIAIALGAIAFAIGSLLPLPFRKQIVGSAGEPVASANSLPAPSAAAHAPAPPSISSSTSTAARPSSNGTVAAQPPTPAPTAVAAPPAAIATEKPAATGATAAPAPGTAATNAPSSGGKNPGRGGKPGRLGDIF